jgi:programmed cell death 6-interacting protein
LRASLAAVDSLSAERASLEDALRAARNRDNPLPKMLAAGGGSPEALFASELKKYDPLLARVSESVEKQKELMTTIEKAQQDYKRLYGFDEWRRSCEDAAAGARGAAETYRELRDNLGEGMRFYSSLREAVASLAQQASDFTAARRLQRDDMVEALRRGAAPPMTSNVPVYAPPPPQYPPAPQWGAAAPPYGQQQQQQQAPSAYAAAYAPPSYYQQQQPPPPPPPPPSGGAGFNPLWNR